MQTDKLVDKFAQSKFTDVRPDKTQKDALVGAQELGLQTALDMDVSEVSMQEAAQLRYYTYQTSGSGTQAQACPPLNPCIAALEMKQTTDEKGREVYEMTRFSATEVLRKLSSRSCEHLITLLLIYN